jgi:hypothetical protein
MQVGVAGGINELDALRFQFLRQLGIGVFGNQQYRTRASEFPDLSGDGSHLGGAYAPFELELVLTKRLVQPNAAISRLARPRILEPCFHPLMTNPRLGAQGSQGPGQQGSLIV